MKRYCRRPFIEIVDIKDKLLRILSSYFDVFATCLMSDFHWMFAMS